ncbi:MAG: hypothetical protein HY814_10805 [Candidatus Riflebacteria bacterium]|nr:hypothetical protein [Candidatus Riflebacteria bacterium]
MRPLATALLLLLSAWLACAAERPRGAAPEPVAGDVPFEVSGDAMPGDASGDVVEVLGNVRVKRGNVTLQADRLRYERKADSALATGEVLVGDGTFILTCRRLAYYVGRQQAIAWDDPLVTRSSSAGPNTTELVEMRATQLTLYADEQRIEGLDRVELTRYLVRDGRRELDVRVRCDEAELDQVSRSCLFRGQVEIESPKMGARARRAFLEEPLDRLTLVGEARAWSIGAGGEQTDQVRGAKILHFLRSQRTLVFGNVHGKLRLEK